MGNGESGGFGMCQSKAEVLADFEAGLPSSIDWDKLVAETRAENVVEPFADRVTRYVTSLTLTQEQLLKMIEAFIHELETGLDCHLRHPMEFVPSECSFKMLDSCVNKLPSGNEKGVFYALDFGGTNFRVVRVYLDGQGNMDLKQVSRSLLSAPVKLPKVLMDRNATASQMFDFFALTVRDFMVENGDMPAGGGGGPKSCDGDGGATPFPCGFTFSFPCAQAKIDSSIAMVWTKGFETGRATDDPVEGMDVCELMNVAFARNGVPVVVNSVLNDTVGTLLSCAYTIPPEQPPCLVGLILGTGVNCCYVDPAATVAFGYTGQIINIEAGNFNRALPQTNIDCTLDFLAIANRGQQQLEKMISGGYLGEICRVAIVKVFEHRAPPLAWHIGSLPTAQAARIMNDTSAGLAVTRATVQEVWRVDLSAELLQVVHALCVAVFDRSAALAAVMIVGCAQKTGRLQPAMGGLTVGIDGTLWTKNKWYQERIRFHINRVLGDTRSALIHLLTADDGSGKGAAILAATFAA